MITEVNLPRVYTNSHNDTTHFIYLGVGHIVNEKLFFGSDEMKRDSVIGRWSPVSKCQSKSKYIITFTADLRPLGTNEFLVSRVNATYCEEFDQVLEAVGIAEFALVKEHPKLAKTPIYIEFLSQIPEYNRTECWGNLGYWLCC